MIFDVFVDAFFFDPGKELRDAADVVGLAVFGRMVAGGKVAERRSGCEEGEEVGREFVRHCDEGSSGLSIFERVRVEQRTETGKSPPGCS